MNKTKNTSQYNKKPFQIKFLSPQYWGIWLVFALMIPLVYLPLSIQFAIGRGVGKLFFKYGKTRRKVTLVNLRLAFPELSEQERYIMAEEVFINQGIGIFETLSAWLRPQKFDNCTVTFDGIEHIQSAQQQRRSVLVLGGHYTMLDLGGLFASRMFVTNCVYRPQSNALLEWFVYNNRRQMFNNQVSHKDMRTLVHLLKTANIVWYTPDQDFGLQSGIMADFFGVPSATITVPRRLAKIGDSNNKPAVVAIHFYRTSSAYLKLGELPSYHVHVTAELDNYPSENELVDAIRVNRLLENLIRIAPSQWMWFHRRYKHNEHGTTNYYD